MSHELGMSSLLWVGLSAFPFEVLETGSFCASCAWLEVILARVSVL